MNDAQDFHKKAEALATLAEMFPERAEQYRAREAYWRGLEAKAKRSPAAKADTRLRRSA